MSNIHEINEDSIFPYIPPVEACSRASLQRQISSVHVASPDLPEWQDKQRYQTACGNLKHKEFFVRQHE
jgi:hypothetical protein